MAAYVVAQVVVNDAQEFEKYRERFPGAIGDSGCRPLAASAPEEVVEGSWPKGITVILEFPSMQKAKDWYNSPAYQEIIPLRENAAETSMEFLNGL